MLELYIIIAEKEKLMVLTRLEKAVRAVFMER